MPNIWTILIIIASIVGLVFLGLFAASILPTVSILMQSLSSSTRSVQKVDDLHAELVGVFVAQHLVGLLDGVEGGLGPLGVVLEKGKNVR